VKANGKAQIANGKSGAGISRAGFASCLVAVIAAGVWAFWPLGAVRIEEPTIAAGPVEAPARAALALDTAAFRAPLWVAPPAPPAPPVAAAPPPPLKVQLLAVVHEDGVYKAVLYDPDSDKLLVLKEGETLGSVGRSVQSVSATAVQIRDQSGVRTLALREDQKGGTP
jgi:hypothetical protein